MPEFNWRNFFNHCALLLLLLGPIPSEAGLRLHGQASAIAVNLGGIETGIASVSYFSNMRPFVNWAVQGANGNGNRAFNSNAISEIQGWQAGYFDSNGDIVASIPSGPTSMAVSIFTIPPAVANSSSTPTTLPVGPVSATFQGTISGNVLTVNSGGFSGTIVAGDQVTAPGLQGTVYNIQAFGSGSTTGTGGAGTYQLNTTATISSAVSMATNTYWWTGLAMTVSWQGTGVTSVTTSGSVGTLGSFPTCTSSPCTFTFGYNPGNFALIFNFASGTASPPTKIDVYETRYATQMAACASGTLISCWSPDWVSVIGPYGIKRYMDMESSNSTGVVALNQYADQNYSHLGNVCGGINAFDGTISATTLTAATSVGGGFGTMEAGMAVQDSTGQLTANTTLLSGTGGSNGTYTVNNSQTIANVTATAAATTLNSKILDLTSATLSGTVFPYASISGTDIAANGGPTIILPYGTSGTTGTGGQGTYALSAPATGSGSGLSLTLSDRMWAYTIPGSWFGTGGTKCGVHPTLLAALADATNTSIHFNVPVTMTMAGMTDIATSFLANLKNGLQVSYELGNENWNGNLGATYYYLQSSGRVTSGLGTGGVIQAGYVMAGLMNAVNTVYGPSRRSSWRGEIGGQLTSNSTVPSTFITGVNQWIAANSPGTLPTALFDDVVIAPYVSDFSNAATITAVTTGNPTSVTISGSTGQALANGQKRRLFFSGASGLSAYNGMDVTLASVSGSTFQFSDFTTTGTFANSGTNWMSPPGFFDMTDDSTACYVNAGASISAGSVTGSVFTAGGTVTGTIRNGQPLSGTGLPANLYITTGSGTSWNLNQTIAGTVTGAMTTAPCATNYQFFAQEYSKALITGGNDYGFFPSTGTTPIATTFANALQPNQLYANSMGFQLRDYEGGLQVQPAGNFVSNATVLDFIQNYFYDPAGNDPNYTPAQVVSQVNQSMQAVWSAFPAHYMVYGGAPGSFDALLYPADTNPLITQVAAENAAGPYIDPTPAATWSVQYNSSTDHVFGSAGSTTLSCTYTGTLAGRALMAVGQTSTVAPSGVTLDGVSMSLDAADTSSTWHPTIWGLPVSASAGSHTVTVTWPSSVSFRNCAALTISNLASNSVESVSTQSSTNQKLSITKGSFVLSVSMPPTTSGVTWLTGSTPSGRISGCPSACSNVNIFDYEASASQGFALAYWSPGPPFNSSIFNVVNNNSDGMISAAYK